jgi:hypothetical protein
MNKSKKENGPLHIVLIGLATLTGFAMFSNGAVMLADPWWWYSTVPGVGRTGPFNQHFIRDIAILYLAIGIAFITDAYRPNLRLAVWAPATLWLTGHAIFHVWEVATGICGPAYLASDFPAVSLPALIGIGLTTWSWKSRVVAAALCLP